MWSWYFSKWHKHDKVARVLFFKINIDENKNKNSKTDVFFFFQEYQMGGNVVNVKFTTKHILVKPIATNEFP